MIMMSNIRERGGRSRMKEQIDDIIEQLENLCEEMEELEEREGDGMVRGVNRMSERRRSRY